MKLLFMHILVNNSICFTVRYQLIAHYFNTLCKTHAKIRRSNPLKFISLIHVSILKDHHQGVNVPIYKYNRTGQATIRPAKHNMT